MKEFTAGTDYKVLGTSEEIDTETVNGHEWCIRMINLRLSPKMLNEWFDTKEKLRSEFEAALKKSLQIPEDNSFVLSQGVAEFFTVVTMHERK